MEHILSTLVLFWARACNFQFGVSLLAWPVNSRTRLCSYFPYSSNESMNGLVSLVRWLNVTLKFNSITFNKYITLCERCTTNKTYVLLTDEDLNYKTRTVQIKKWRYFNARLSPILFNIQLMTGLTNG